MIQVCKFYIRCLKIYISSVAVTNPFLVLSKGIEAGNYLHHKIDVAIDNEQERKDSRLTHAVGSVSNEACVEPIPSLRTVIPKKILKNLNVARFVFGEEGAGDTA